MSDSIQPLPSLIQLIPYDCDTLFFKPYEQGLKNLRDAWMAQRIEEIAAAPGEAPIMREHPLSLMGRVTTAVIGVLLLVPIINTLVLIILKQCDSPCLHAPFRQPTNPLRMAALARMETIKTVDSDIGRFEVIPALITFNFNQILEGCPSSPEPSLLNERLNNLMTWSGTDEHNKLRVQNFLAQFDQSVAAADTLSPAHKHNITVIKTLLSKMQAYFVIKKSAIEPDSMEETNLRSQYRNTLSLLCGNNIDTSFQNFPSKSFIYTTMNALQDIMLSAAENFLITSLESPLERLHFRATQIIFREKIHRILTSMNRSRTEEERYLIMQALSIIPNLDPFQPTSENLADVVSYFQGQMRPPLQTLLGQLDRRSSFYEELVQWADNHFQLGLQSEDPELKDQEMIRQIFENNGQITNTGILFLLEAAGIIRLKEADVPV